MYKIKKDDEVVILCGKDKGRKGKVLRVFRSKERLLIEGINLVKKHVKPNPQMGQEGGIVSKEATIHISNVAVWNPLAQKADKIGIKLLEDGSKVRYFKSNNELVDSAV